MENSTDDILSSDKSSHIINQHLWKYVGVSILVIGTIGHVLSIITVAFSKILRKQSSTIFIVAMSITGIIALYFGLLRYTIHIGIGEWKLDIREHSTIFCKLHMTITYAALQYFAWLQATVAVDRLISVKWPYIYMSQRKWKVAVIAIVVELLVIVGVNMLLAVDVRLDENGHCTPKNRDFYINVWSYIDLANYSLLPMFVIIVSNTLILWILSRSKFKKNSNSRPVACSLTTMLMSLNVMFVITTLPISVVASLDWGVLGEDDRYTGIEICWTVFSLMQYAGSAGTFYLYCITGSKFREELKKLFTKCCPCLAAKKTQASNRPSQKKFSENTDYKTLNVSINAEETSMTAYV